MRDRLAVWAGSLSFLVTGGLTVRVIAIDKPAVFVVLVPALVGALLGIWRHGRPYLGLSALLTAATAMFGLIGGWGLLYVPSIVLLVWAALMPRQLLASR